MGGKHEQGVDSVSVSDVLSMTDSVSVKQRTYFSIQHIQSAALFARRSAAIEQDYDGRFDDALFAEHRAYVTSSIFSSAAFLEATINELFADTVDNPHGDVQLLNPDVKALMAEMWQRGVPRTASYPIVQKYQIALALARQAPFDPGKLPVQDADIVVKVRNALIHYEPEWTVGLAGVAPAEVVPHRFEKALRGKFALNPLTSAGNPFFPDRCLSHGCAEWAVKSSLQLTDAFYSTIGLPAPYEHVRGRLGTS